MPSSHLENTRFIIICRNPYALLASMYRRPYHALRTFDTVKSFLTSPFPVYPRDSIDAATLTPPALWTTKHLAYHTFSQIPRYIATVCYEDLTTDGIAVLRQLSEQLRLSPRGPLRLIDHGIKRTDHASRNEYEQCYLSERWRRYFTAGMVAGMNDQMDAQVLITLGYTTLAASEFPQSTTSVSPHDDDHPSHAFQ